MAVGATYPAVITNANGDETQGIDITFTDSGNQPSGDTVPFQPAVDGTVTIVEDSGGDPAYVYDDDGGQHTFTGSTVTTGAAQIGGDAHVTGGATVGTTLLVGTEASVGDVSVGGLTGAVAGGRFVGFTATVAPTTGTFAVGDVVVSLNGSAWVCTVAGSPGTWVGLQSVLLAPKAAPTFTGHVTVPQATAVLDAAALNQLTSALTITSGTLPNLGTWSSGTAIQNPVTRQITVNVAFVTNGTANAATCAIAISPDNVTFTTIGTLTASAAVNTVGAVQLVSPVNLPAAWYIKLTFSQGTVAASIYY